MLKEKIHLEKEMETLLIPLYGRAKMSEEGLCKDVYAKQTLQAIDYDFDKLKIVKKLQIFMAIRSSILDDYIKDFLETRENSLVISLGSGLDARYARMRGYREWIDLDYPEVALLREKVLPEHENHRTIASSVTDGEWIANLAYEEREVLVIAEGLLMYLAEDEIDRILDALIVKFPNTTFIFDAYSKLTVRKIKGQSSLKKTGATIRWGIDNPQEIESRHKNLCYIKTLYLTDEKYIRKLRYLYRVMFRLVGKFEMAKEAHRILIYQTK